jgi:indole-3-glycerol phosphate synthase
VTNILDKIIDRKQAEIESAKRERPLESLQEQLSSAPPVRDFVASIAASKQDIAVIAEVKKASPSAGLIRDDFDPVSIARTYEARGAACVSVLTDEEFFQGSLDHMRTARDAVSLPVLRKDFVLDRYQVLEARVAGADCVLLIAECLDDCRLRDLYFYISELGMDALLEVYDPQNLDAVLKLDPPLVGVNNRNLKTFVTDLEHSIRLAGRVPQQTILVSESGIRDRQDVTRLRDAGIRAILVGETLMREPNPGDKLDELLGN